MTRKLAVAALVPVLALGLGACGSSGTDGGSPPSASSRSSSASPMSSMPMPSGSTTTEPAAPSASSAAEATEAVISITDFAYRVPASVAPGAEVIIENGDTEAHTVTSKDGGFDVTVAPSGTTTMVAPTKPGRYRFVCSFHANMTGTLVVQ